MAEKIGRNELKQRLDEGRDFTLIEVLSRDQYDRGPEAGGPWFPQRNALRRRKEGLGRSGPAHGVRVMCPMPRSSVPVPALFDFPAERGELAADLVRVLRIQPPHAAGADAV